MLHWSQYKRVIFALGRKRREIKPTLSFIQVNYVSFHYFFLPFPPFPSPYCENKSRWKTNVIWTPPSTLNYPNHPLPTPPQPPRRSSTRISELSANSVVKINYFSLINLFIHLTPCAEKPINNVKHALSSGTGPRLMSVFTSWAEWSERRGETLSRSRHGTPVRRALVSLPRAGDGNSVRIFPSKALSSLNSYQLWFARSATRSINKKFIFGDILDTI